MLNPPRETFLSSELNNNRVYEMLDEVTAQLSLREVLKMVREISFNLVQMDSPIYQDNLRTGLNIEQANQLQSQLKALCDLFGQSIIDKRTFDTKYLRAYDFAGPYISRIKSLEKELEELKYGK